MKTSKTFKKIAQTALVIAVVAGASGCSAIADLNARGQALYNADPAAYDAMSLTGKDSGYFSQNPQYNVHGS